MGCVLSTLLLLIILSFCCLRRTKGRTDSQQGIRRTFLISPERREPLRAGLLNSHYLPSRCDTDDRIRRILLLAGTGSPIRRRSQKSLRQMFRTCFLHAKMRGRELRIVYVVDLTNYFASASSSRPLQSLVSSFKRKRVGSVRYPMWVPY